MRRRLGAALLAAAVPFAACSREAERPAAGGFPRGPVLLVGFDGFEWSAVLPLLREGRLPHLAALLRRGSFGTLESISARNSPALWTTIATGKSIEKHGIRDFLKARKPAVFYTSADRRVKAFWNMLSERGQRVSTIGWFVTHPVEPVSGWMVAQANTSEVMKARHVKKGSVLPGLSGQVHPVEREDEVFEVLEEVERDLDAIVAERLRERIEDAPARFRGPIEASRWAFRADAAYERLALRAAAEAPDVLAVYFGATDVIGHRFWPFARTRRFPDRLFTGKLGKRLAPRMAPGSWGNALLGGLFWRAMQPVYESGWPGQVLARTYEHADATVGRLVAAMPPDTRVIVVSDHGFRPWHHTDGPEGFFVAAGPGLRDMEGPEPQRLSRDHLRRLGRIHDVGPTLLALAGLPVGLDMDGRPIEAVLAPDPRLQRPAPIATWDDPAWLAARQAAGQASSPPAEEEEEERLEQLRALGYIQ
ncbi:MAG TPA: alkaline phosphatase family protein [Vicinamibacteria bacterium]|nr:alkaline phosphatase family protein [Vicinamibacteria bacterium]